MEPPVSVPSAANAVSAATAAAEPPLEPPGTRERSHGLRVTPEPEFSVDEPMANSSMFVRPKGTAPASRRRAMTVASYGRAVAGEDLGGAGARVALDADDVLDGDGHAAERQGDVGAGGVGAGEFEVGGEVAADGRVDLGDAFGEGVEGLDGGDVAAAEQRLQGGDGEEREIGGVHENGGGANRSVSGSGVQGKCGGCGGRRAEGRRAEVCAERSSSEGGLSERVRLSLGLGDVPFVPRLSNSTDSLGERSLPWRPTSIYGLARRALPTLASDFARRA